jgi:hypothetical protein
LSIKVFGCFDTGNLLRIGSFDNRCVAYYSFKADILEGYLGFNRPYKETKLVKQQIQDKVSLGSVVGSLKQFGETPVTVSQ